LRAPRHRPAGEPPAVRTQGLAPEELNTHFPALKTAIDALGADYNRSADQLVHALFDRIQDLFQEFSRDNPHRGFWRTQIENFCAPLVILGPAGLQGHGHRVARQSLAGQPDTWKLIASSAVGSLEVALGENEQSGGDLWAIIPVALDDPFGQARAAIEALRPRFDACKVQFATACAAQDLRGNCDLAPDA
jgi:hypothetical protein